MLALGCSATTPGEPTADVPTAEVADVADAADAEATRDAVAVRDAVDAPAVPDATVVPDVVDVPVARDVVDVPAAPDVVAVVDVPVARDVVDVTTVLDVVDVPVGRDVVDVVDVPVVRDVPDVPDVVDAPEPPVETRAVSGHVLYAGRRPDAARMAWGPAVNFYAQDFAVVSGYGRTPRTLDTVRTRAGSVDAGAFTVRVRATPDDTDFIMVVATASDARGVAYGVADPVFAAGAWPYDARLGRGVDPTAPRWWTWRWRADALPVSGDLVIDEASGSGAAFVFDLMGIASRVMATRFPTPMRTVIAWLGPEVESSCGPVACYDDRAVDALGQRFEGQLWFPGTSANQSYYAASTVMHELAHHVMATWGTPPHEGGAHYLGATTSPGLAWSEGYAHWFSSDVRGDSTHFDRHLVRTSGTSSVVTLWKDLALRTWSSGGSLGSPARARPDAGLLQPLDEDDIAAMLWSLDAAPTGSAPFYAALTHPRMQRSTLFYGYHRLGDGALVPVFPDYLDALACAGVDASRVRAVTQPARYYPYPDASVAPRCGLGAESPFVAWWRVAQSTRDDDLIEARVTVRAPVASTIAVRVEGPALRGGDARARTLPAGVTGDVVVGRWWVTRGAGAVMQADAGGTGWRVRAETASAAAQGATRARW